MKTLMEGDDFPVKIFCGPQSRRWRSAGEFSRQLKDLFRRGPAENFLAATP
jgi:hypothetical protein